MLEASNAFNLAIPLIISVFISKLIADIFSSGLYDREIRETNMPLLMGSCPSSCKNMKAHEIMSKKLITITTIAEMRQI